MMKSFSYINSFNIDDSLYYLLWSEIEKLRRYFSKFCGQNTDEAMQATLMHALTHYTEAKGEVSAYIKALARDITKDNGRLIFVDFLEQTLAEDNADDSNKPKVDAGSISDFSGVVVNKLMISSHKRKEIAELALCFIDKFMLMCEAIINRDTTTNYYPDIYIKECIKLSRGCENFNQICVSLYNEYRDKFIEFLSYNTKTQGEWRETDFPLISQSMSKRFKFVCPDTGQVVEDPDIEEFKLVGNLGNKRVLKVYYYDIWEMMCDYVDSPDINVMRFTIDDSYIIRTLGGSITVVNPDLFNIYDLCRTEILSNVLHNLNCRCISIGSENFYLLANGDDEIDIPKRIVKGIPIELKAEDITDYLR